MRHQRQLRGRGGGRVVPADDQGGEADRGEGAGEDADGEILGDIAVRAGPGSDSGCAAATVPE